jgi:DNA-binding NarL/FixJ family response regulator
MVGGLTPRQQDVAALVACGLSNKQIARRSGITVGTVKDHVHAILRATGCRSRAELIVRVHGGQASVAQAAEPSI